MSGSGPTLFAAFTEAAEAWAFYKEARRIHQRRILTSTLDQSALDQERVMVVT